jgi:hypothetical protein
MVKQFCNTGLLHKGKGKTMSMAGEIENSEHAIKEIQAELQSLIDKIDKLQFRLGVEQLRLEQLKKLTKG